MNPLRSRWLPILLLFPLLLAGCVQSDAPEATGGAEGVVDLDDGRTVVVTGPYAHENLTVYLIHSGVQEKGDFITLDEGLKKGVVKVNEKEQEQVNELVIDNQSDQPLFLQEGDRVIGGKQDRTIYASLVIPPHSGKMALPAFCVEPGRWREGAPGAAFNASNTNVALSPKSVRSAAKVDKSQQEVWNQVGVVNALASQARLAEVKTSSLNESLESPQVAQLMKDCEKALGEPLKDKSDAIGVIIAVNGQVEEVNIYPNHGLLTKLYPRLLQSYALQAVLEKEKARDAPETTVGTVCAFMRDNAAKQKQLVRDEQVNRDNGMKVQFSAAGAVNCDVCYTRNGKSIQVHKQILTQTPAEAARRQQAVQPRQPGQQDGVQRQELQNDNNLEQQIQRAIPRQQRSSPQRQQDGQGPAPPPPNPAPQR